ncbi:RNA-guided endonuclease InsQ/TnpB family protein [Saccharothrix stipae]
MWSFAEVDVAALSPTVVVVSREPDGRWYATSAIETEEPEPRAATGYEVGVDLGLKVFLVTSDGDRVANPRRLVRKTRNPARHQRRLARCQRGSNNRRKVKAKVARARRKVRDTRHDFLHRTSTKLVRSAVLIAIEDRQLEYKAARAGRAVVVIDRWYPSSKTCSACGHLLAELKLSVRHWTCPDCRTRHDRDLNAARNILAAGRAVARGDSGDACGADVRRQGPPFRDRL